MDFGPEVLLILVGTSIALAFGVLSGVRKARRRRGGDSAQVARSVSRATGFGLAKGRRGLWESIVARSNSSESTLAALEEVLLGADVGTRVTQRILARLQDGSPSMPSADAMRGRLAEIMTEVLSVAGPRREENQRTKPQVIFVVGVNGVGKTTTVAKLAQWFRHNGQRVLVVAADTFRAAAVEQLETWTSRIGVDLVRQKAGSDPGAVLFDGLKAAVAREADVVLVDTAGRLHAKRNLMEELRKLARVAARAVPGAPHDVWLVLDATVGQNGLAQARSFAEAVPLTGLVLTKLDGTAKGGVALAVVDELQVPIRFVGTGEKLTDLEAFDPGAFVQTLLGEVPVGPSSSAVSAA